MATVYCFYQYDKSMTKDRYRVLRESGATQKDINAIYACTTEKELADEFLATRRKDKFLLFKYKMDREDASDFINAHHGALLVRRHLRHFKNIKENDYNNEVTIPVVLTENEVTETDLMVTEWVYHAPFNLEFSNPYRLKDSITKALLNLSYIDLYRLLSVNSQDQYESFNGGEFDFPTPPDIIFDEYNVFVYCFGHLFKSKIYKKPKVEL